MNARRRGQRRGRGRPRSNRFDGRSARLRFLGSRRDHHRFSGQGSFLLLFSILLLGSLLLVRDRGQPFLLGTQHIAMEASERTLRGSSIHRDEGRLDFTDEARRARARRCLRGPCQRWRRGGSTLDECAQQAPQITLEIRGRAGCESTECHPAVLRQMDGTQPALCLAELVGRSEHQISRSFAGHQRPDPIESRARLPVQKPTSLRRSDLPNGPWLQGRSSWQPSLLLIYVPRNRPNTLQFGTDGSSRRATLATIPRRDATHLAIVRPDARLSAVRHPEFGWRSRLRRMRLLA